jgi:tetratricopeptide (TPR) repeat protein
VWKAFKGIEQVCWPRPTFLADGQLPRPCGVQFIITTNPESALGHNGKWRCYSSRTTTDGGGVRALLALEPGNALPAGPDPRPQSAEGIEGARAPGQQNSKEMIETNPEEERTVMTRRPHARSRTGLVAFLTLLLLAGCAAGKSDFDLGQTLAAQQKWDEAIRAYEQALQKEPDNAQYRASLAQARAGAAQAELRTATAMAGAMAQVQEVERALQAVERASGTIPARAHAGVPGAPAEAAVGALPGGRATPAGGRPSRSGGVEPGRAGGTPRAGHRSRERGGDPPAAGGGPRRGPEPAAGRAGGPPRSGERRRGISRRRSRGIRATRRSRAGFGRPSNGTTSRYYLGRAGQLEADGQIEKAFGFLRLAGRYWPNDVRVRDAMERWRARAAPVLRRGVRRADSDDWESPTALVQATQAFGAATGVEPALRGMVRELAAKLYDRALEFENQKLWGNTWLWLRTLQQVDPAYRDTANKVEQTREKLLDRASLKIAVLELEPPKAAPDAGSIVSGSIVTNLFKLGRKDFKVIEREALQSIIKEISIGQAGVLDVETAKEIGKIAGIDTILVGRVLQYKVDQNEAEGRKTVTVQVGSRTVPNPAYEMHLAEVREGRKKATDGAPAQTIHEPVHQLFTYRVGTVTAIGYVSVSFRLVGVEREILLAEKIDEQEAFRQDYSEGVEAAGIQAVAKDTPIPTEVLNRVTEKVVGKIVALIARHYGSRQQYYLEAGRELQRRRQFTRAVEEYMNSTASAELEKTGEQYAAQARSHIEELMRQ